MNHFGKATTDWITQQLSFVGSFGLNYATKNHHHPDDAVEKLNNSYSSWNDYYYATTTRTHDHQLQSQEVSSSSSSSEAFIWPHAAANDYRTPLFTFMLGKQEYGFYNISVMYWLEMLVIMLFEAAVAVVFSIIVYRYIIVPNYNKPNNSKTNNNSNSNSKTKNNAGGGSWATGGNSTTQLTAYLLGFGLIIPFWCLFPSYVVDMMSVRNKLYRFCMAAVTPTLCVFRTTEAMYGFSPEHAIENEKAFMVYFGSPMVAKYDNTKKEFVRASREYYIEKLLVVVGSFVRLGIIYSVFLMLPNTLPQFDIEYDEQEWYSLRHLFSIQNLFHSFCYAGIFQYTLATSGDGGNFVSSLITGYEMEPFMTNPMFESQTMAEFWGKRWNKLIQTLLKRGIFKPMRSCLPKFIAMAGCFAVSGIFHEWLMMIIFAPLPQDIIATNADNDNNQEYNHCGKNECYKLVWGSALFFFMWMGVLIAWEFIFLPKSYFKQSSFWYKACMGSAALVGCPFFMAPYVHTTFFKDGFLGYFVIQPIHQQQS